MLHRVKVRREWLTRGDVIELELPRNLACAACGGGGCDACGRSGAITLRRRDEPAEVLEVTLPATKGRAVSAEGGVTLRIPEQGGLPEPGSALPRGVLLLTVVPSAAADGSIKLLRGAPSKQPSASVEAGGRALGGFAARGGLAVPIMLVAVALWIVLLIWLRLTGRG